MNSRRTPGGSNWMGSSIVTSSILLWAGHAFAQAPAAEAQTPPGAAPAPAATAPVAPAEPTRKGGLTELEAMKVLVEHNPSLHVALLQEAQARASVQGEEALYDPVFNASAGITHTRSPGLVRGGGIAMSQSDSQDLGLGLSKTFSLGTVLALTVAGQRSVRTSPITVASGAVATLGPGYSLATKLSATQPFLRGAGKDVGLATLRQARLNRTATVLNAQQTASQLLQDALLAYWELWYGDETVSINQASRDLAREQERQSLEQVAAGSIARADALPYMTKRAELEESVISATTDRLARAITLAQALGEPERGGPELYAGDPVPADTGAASGNRQAVDEALANSPQIKRLETQIALTRDQAKIAGNALKPRLDLEGYLQAQGLGYQEVPPVFEQTGRLQALSAHLGLIFETPLTDTRREAQIQNAELAVHIATKQLEATRQQLRAQVMTAMANRDAARSKLQYAEETERVAHDQAEAERARFLAGASVALLVLQAEDSWRQSQLRVRRARVDLVEADIKLLHLRGRLLERYSTVLDGLRPAAAGLPSGVGWGPW